MDVEELPYRAEYAKSDRSSCKNCKRRIGKEVLRLAKMVQSPKFDGKMPQWYHSNCFFQKFRPKSIAQIAQIESLRYEDQEKLIAKISSLPGEIFRGRKGRKRSAKTANNISTNKNINLKNYIVEYAKSSRSLCRGCEQNILTDNIRISKKENKIDRWHHLECFIKIRNELEFFACGDILPGFESLNPEDKNSVKQQIPIIEQNDIPIKKLKLEVDDDLEKDLQYQSQLMFKNRDYLKKLKKKELSEILKHNEQLIPVGIDEMLNLLGDIMSFGALEKCSNCKDGNFIYNKSNYVCQGNLSEWTKCQNTVEEPKRKLFEIPEKYENHECFKNYKCILGTRKFRTLPPAEDEVKKGPKIKHETGALLNMRFLITGFKKDKLSKLKTEIKNLGGVVQKEFNDSRKPLTAIITTQTQVDSNKNYHIQTAERLKIYVVSEEFVNEAKHAETIPELLDKTSICSWGKDAKSRLPEIQKSSVQKISIKGAGIVDPLSLLDDVAHVYKEGKDLYSVMLSLTDLQINRNSFYKIQILEFNTRKLYWVFRSWGRIATTIGGNKIDDMGSLQKAKNLFKELYEEKTGNKWENRHNFIKSPGKMYPVDIDEELEELELKNWHVPSVHPQNIQDLIKLIFDEKRMNQTLAEYDLDLNKMPLGKLSKKQIESAYSVLTELQNLINDRTTANNKFIDCSNRFYTFIPHSFGVQNPPLINTIEMIKEKSTMLDNLLEIEIAYKMLIKRNVKNNIIDDLYEELETDFKVLDKNSDEFKIIQDYVKNTHTSTHTYFTLEIEDVFKIKRHGEGDRYEPFRKLHNKKLLWHGSRLTNFAGILSQGLRIAPPEAPVTGYMFGKGIYFADMVSKSANYCATNKFDPTGLMLLCEVALGNMYEKECGEFIEKLPDDKHSTKGLGKSYPNPKQSIFENDVEIPVGKEVNTNNQYGLMYNEYPSN